MSNDLQKEASPTIAPLQIVRTGVLYAVLLSVVYYAVGYLGTLLGWSRRSSVREWILATIIAFLIGCLVAIKSRNNAVAQQEPPRDTAISDGGSTL